MPGYVRSMLTVLAMLLLSTLTERRRAADARRVVALDEVQRRAQAEAYAAALASAVDRYTAAVGAWRETIPDAYRGDPDRRADVAAAVGAIRRLREAHQGVTGGRHPGQSQGRP